MPASALFLTLAIGFSALAIGVSGCGPRIADRNIDALNHQYELAEKAGKGLSMKEVEAVLGQPTRVEGFPIEVETTKDLQGVRYYYEEDGKLVVLHFIDNKLIRRASHFGEKPPEETEMRQMPPKPEN